MILRAAGSIAADRHFVFLRLRSSRTAVPAAPSPSCLTSASPTPSSSAKLRLPLVSPVPHSPFVVRRSSFCASIEHRGASRTRRGRDKRQRGRVPPTPDPDPRRRAVPSSHVTCSRTGCWRGDMHSAAKSARPGSSSPCGPRSPCLDSSSPCRSASRARDPTRLEGRHCPPRGYTTPLFEGGVVSFSV